MKNITKTIILFSLLILLSSCWKEEEKQKELEIKNLETKQEQTLKIETRQAWTTNIFKERKIETKLEDNKLSVWKNVVISEWQSEFLDFEFPIVEWWKIYKNSNVKKYWFVISWKYTSVDFIKKFYQRELSQLWWEEEIIETQEELIEVENQEEDINLNSSANLVFLKAKSDNIFDELKIKITSDIPQILKENYEFEWNYIEFYLGSRINQEELIENELQNEEIDQAIN